MNSQEIATVEDYIDGFPQEVQAVLQQIRRTIHDAVPGAQETISYKMPTVTLDGKYLVYFAGWKHHVSLYPLPTLDAATDAEVEPYRSGKGTVKFPLDRPIPYDLVARLVKLLADQHGPAKP